MLKKPASLSCSFGLSGLSGFLVERNKPDEPNQPDKQNKPNQIDQTDRAYPTRADIEVLVCRISSFHSLIKLNGGGQAGAKPCESPSLDWSMQELV